MLPHCVRKRVKKPKVKIYYCFILLSHKGTSRSSAQLHQGFLSTNHMNKCPWSLIVSLVLTVISLSDPNVHRKKITAISLLSYVIGVAEGLIQIGCLGLPISSEKF